MYNITTEAQIFRCSQSGKIFMIHDGKKKKPEAFIASQLPNLQTIGFVGEEYIRYYAENYPDIQIVDLAAGMTDEQKNERGIVRGWTRPIGTVQEISAVAKKFRITIEEIP